MKDTTNCREAIRNIRDNGTGGKDEVIAAIAWSLAHAVGGGKPIGITITTAHSVYETLIAAGFRVVKQ